MEAIARPLRVLQEEIAWFTRASELRVLHVGTDGTLRGPAIDLVMGYENHSDNRGLFLRFDDAVEGLERGWPARIQRLRDQLAEKTIALAPAGIQLRPLGEISGASRGTAAEFAATLRKVAGMLAPPLTNVVVVMAPVRIEDKELFAQEMSALVGAPQLGHVRWILVEGDGAILASVALRLGKDALACTCVVDGSAEQDDLKAMGAATVSAAPVPVARTSTWRAPGAMPDTVPPARVGMQPVQPSDEHLVAAGLSPKFVNGGGEALKSLILGGALAMRQGKHADAITLQSRAAVLCAEMNMPREQVINLHVLGGYLLAATLHDRARKAYQEARDIARKNGLVDVEAQTELALGMLEALGRRPAEAATHYAAAGRLAEAAKLEPLAIECWRMAGQLALDSRLEQSAVECWKRALDVAGALDAAVAKMTSAAEVARALAAVCRKRGLLAQAQSLEQRSIELDQGPVTSGPAVATAS